MKRSEIKFGLLINAIGCSHPRQSHSVMFSLNKLSKLIYWFQPLVNCRLEFCFWHGMLHRLKSFIEVMWLFCREKLDNILYKIGERFMLAHRFSFISIMFCGTWYHVLWNMNFSIHTVLVSHFFQTDIFYGWIINNKKWIT